MDRPHHWRAYWFAAVGLCALVGCRSYRAEPLDLPAHRQAWLARSAADESVADFVRRLGARAPGAPVFNPGDGLTLTEGELVALFFNPELRLARLRAQGALASAAQAGRLDDPVLGVDAERVLKSVKDPWVIGATMGFTIPFSGRLGVEKSLAGAEHRVELARVVRDEWATRVALRSAWLEWSAHAARVELTRDLLARLDAILAIVTRLEQAGELSRTEARLFRIERATRQAELRTLESRAAERELGLRAIMGLSPGAPLTLLPEVTADEPDPARSPDDTSPELGVLRAEHAAAEEALRLEIRRQYPDLEVGPGLGSEDGDPRALLGLSVPLPLWNRNQRAIAEADSGRAVARAAFETGFERLAGDLAAARLRLAAARANHETFEREIIPLVEEQRAEGERVAALGEVDTLLLLETLTRLHETKTGVLDARLEESLAIVRIGELLGPPAPARESAPTPDPTPQGAAP